ncbi:hypothetical protein BTM36_19375 [Herbaspirillum sp. VT-16-41]|nr:hypothetical protein BTM36_19375 [Herbaspirillum sp. VT-16-41]
MRGAQRTIGLLPRWPVFCISQFMSEGSVLENCVAEQTGAYYIDLVEDAADATFTFRPFRKEPEDYSCWSLTVANFQTKYGEMDHLERCRCQL